jgi:hypothetical protein
VMLSRLLSTNAFPEELQMREIDRAFTHLVGLQVEWLGPATSDTEAFREAAEHRLRGAFEALKSPNARQALARHGDRRSLLFNGSYEHFKTACRQWTLETPAFMEDWRRWRPGA